MPVGREEFGGFTSPKIPRVEIDGSFTVVGIFFFGTAVQNGPSFSGTFGWEFLGFGGF